MRVPHSNYQQNYSSVSFKRSNAAPQNFFILAAAFASVSLLCWATTWHLPESFIRNAAVTLVLPSSQVMRRLLFGVALRIVSFAGNHFARVFSSFHALKAFGTDAAIVRLTLIS